MDFKPQVSEISLKQVQLDAEQSFKDGFFCCEAVVDAIINNFKIDVPKEFIRTASGMAIGVGKSGCLCGAVNGGVVALGIVFGRTEKTGPKDENEQKLLTFTKDLHDWFMQANEKNSTCCRVLTKEFDMGKGEHKPQCIYFTGLCAWKTAEIIAKEFNIKVVDDTMIHKNKEELHV